MKLIISLTCIHLSVLYLSSSCSFASDGCYVTTGVSEPRVYYFSQSGTSQPRRFYEGTQYYIFSCNSISNTTRTYAVNNGSPIIPVTRNTCYANYVGSGSGFDNSGNYTLNGTPIDFSIYNCPIDEFVVYFIPILMLLALIKMNFNE